MAAAYIKVLKSYANFMNLWKLKNGSFCFMTTTYIQLVI